MKQKQPLYTDKEIANFMMTETMNAYERGGLYNYVQKALKK